MASVLSLLVVMTAALAGQPDGERLAVAPATPSEPLRIATAEQPQVVSWRIPFPDKRKREMARYSQRHYGIDTYKLSEPRSIVEHVAVTSSVRAVYNTFAPDRRDPELRELPGTCAHYVVDRDGTIYQLVSLRIMCRHALGMNHTSLGIEHVGMSDSDVLRHRRQWRASLALSAWLRCRYGIRDRDVIGHAETLSSPHFRERVKKLADSTHSDMKRATMRRYRADLRKISCG